MRENNTQVSTHASTNSGVVFKKTIGQYHVHTEQGEIPCALSAMLHKEITYSAAGADHGRRKVRNVREANGMDPVAVGDRVRFTQAPNGTGTIVEILPRRNWLSRKSAVPMPDAHAFEQVIVANVDQAVPVFAAASPSPSWHMLDRYLVAAESNDLRAVVVINKVDLVRGASGELDADIAGVVAEYRRIGYPVVLCSATSGEGLAELQAALAGRVSVLVGKSGVGKSSLLNALQPGLGLRVNEVSRGDGRGKHTTSHMQMFPLAFGGAIVDTPGTREFGLWEIDADLLDEYFPEMRPFVGRCRFGMTCRHNEEPGCAVRAAVAGGQIDNRRFMSYMRLRSEA